MHQSTRKHCIAVCDVVAIVGLAFLVASLATDRWIESSPVYRGNDTNANNATARDISASISFGLFVGHRSINYGLSPRPYNLKVSCNAGEQVCAFDISDSSLNSQLDTLLYLYKNQTVEGWRSMHWFGLFSFPIYVATLVMIILAIIGGFLATGFGIFNVFGRPIETITGPSGLYLWNILPFLFSTAAIGTFLGLYFSQLEVNILYPDELKFGFTSDDHTDLGFSFYFVVAAAGCFFLNLIFLSLSGFKCSCQYSRTGEKEMDNGIILY